MLGITIKCCMDHNKHFTTEYRHMSIYLCTLHLQPSFAAFGYHGLMHLNFYSTNTNNWPEWLSFYTESCIYNWITPTEPCTL